MPTTPRRPAELETPTSRRRARQAPSRVRQHERQVSSGQKEKRQLASRRIMEGVVALHSEIPSFQYENWTLARRRAWDRRFSDPYSYFYHYCHPQFDARIGRWSIQEHCLFLSAISKISPIEKNWPVVSLLVPGRTGSDCRRYYHRIGRAGLITVKGTLRKRLFCRASISTFDNDGKKNGRMSSLNPLFRRSALRRFLPSTLPPVDDSLLQPFKPQPISFTEEQLDALTHIPTHYEEYDRKRVVKNITHHHHSEEKPEKQKRNRKVPCRITLRSSVCSGATKSHTEMKKEEPQAGMKKSGNNRGEIVFDYRENDMSKTTNLGSSGPPTSAGECKRPRDRKMSTDSTTDKSKHGKSTPRIRKPDRSIQNKQYLKNSSKASGVTVSVKTPNVVESPRASDAKDAPLKRMVSKKWRAPRARSQDSDTVIKDAGQSSKSSTGVEAPSWVKESDVLERHIPKGSPSDRTIKSECHGGVSHGNNKHSTNSGDVENIDFVMDMLPVDDSEYSQQHLERNLNTDESSEKRGQGNKKRVLAPTTSERASISFLVTNEDEPEAKQPRVMKTLFIGSIQKGQSAKGDKMEEMGCLLRLFADSVDETGKALCHHFERNRLLQRYNDYVIRVRSGVKEGSLFHAAKLLPSTGERDTLGQVANASLDCSRCLHDNLDYWRRELDDMMERQLSELNTALRIARVMYV